MSSHDTCVIEGCEAKIHARGLCRQCYERARYKGYLDEVALTGARPRKTKTIRERFEKLVDRSPHHMGCWIWAGLRDKDGYGRIRVMRDGLSRMGKAHRVSYEIHKGPIPDGMHVMHTCHNGVGGCVNPAHLKIATPRENHRDVDRRGERHPNAKAPDAVVADAVRRYRSGGISKARLARELTANGWPTAERTISRWLDGTYRRDAMT